MSASTLPLALSELPRRPQDFRKENLMEKDIHDIRFVGGKFTKCNISGCISGEYLVLDQCTVEKCIISGAVVNNHSVIRNTIIIDAYVTQSELHNCTIIQSNGDSCKIVSCSIREEDNSDTNFNIPTEANFSDWDMDLDIFPLEELYLSIGEINYLKHEQERDPPDLKFSSCEIIGSQVKDSIIQSTKLYSGHIGDSNICTSVLTQLAAYNCNIGYSEARDSRLEQSTLVHTLLKSCFENGNVVKYRASGLSLSVLPSGNPNQNFRTCYRQLSWLSIGFLGPRFGANLERSTPALVKALRVERTNLYQEALQTFAENYYFRLRFPEELKNTRIPSQSLRRLSIRGTKTVPIENDTIAAIRYYSLSDFDGATFPPFPLLMNLHMSIEVWSEEQVIDDFVVMIYFAKRHHRLYSPEPPRKAQDRGYVDDMNAKISRALGVLPVSTRMRAYEVNGHDLPGEPAIYIPKQNWGGSQYTWTWTNENYTLEWETED